MSRRRALRFRKSLAIGAVALTAAAVVAAPSSASSDESLQDHVRKALGGASTVSQDKKVQPQGANGLNPVFDRQQPLTNLIDAVESRSDAKGMVKAKLDVPNMTVTFFWQGEPPAEVREFVKSSAGNGITVEFRAVRFTSEELHAEAKRVLKAYPEVIQAGPNSDLTGITVGIDAQRASVDSVEIASSVPVEVFSASPRQRAVRYADSAPFWGGAMLAARANDSLCSAGYVVNMPNGGRGAITAAHCVSNDDFWMAGISDRVYGISVDEDWQTDARVLVGPTYDPAIYTGAWDSTEGTGKAVSGWRNPRDGEWVCHGGALSGEVCNDVLVYRTEQYWEYDDDIVGPGFDTLKQSRNASAGNGDSGGPTYLPRNAAGEDKAVILGMISNMDPGYEDWCQGVPTDNSRRCSLMVGSINVGAINLGLGVTPATQ